MLKTKSKNAPTDHYGDIRPKVPQINNANFDVNIFLAMIKGKTINEISSDRCLTPGTIKDRFDKCVNILQTMKNQKIDIEKINNPATYHDFWYPLYKEYRLNSILYNPDYIESTFFNWFKLLNLPNQIRILRDLEKTVSVTQSLKQNG